MRILKFEFCLLILWEGNDFKNIQFFRTSRTSSRFLVSQSGLQENAPWMNISANKCSHSLKVIANFYFQNLLFIFVVTLIQSNQDLNLFSFIAPSMASGKVVAFSAPYNHVNVKWNMIGNFITIIINGGNMLITKSHHGH